MRYIIILLLLASCQQPAQQPPTEPIDTAFANSQLIRDSSGRIVGMRKQPCYNTAKSLRRWDGSKWVWVQGNIDVGSIDWERDSCRDTNCTSYFHNKKFTPEVYCGEAEVKAGMAKFFREMKEAEKHKKAMHSDGCKAVMRPMRSGECRCCCKDNNLTIQASEKRHNRNGVMKHESPDSEKVQSWDEFNNPYPVNVYADSIIYHKKGETIVKHGKCCIDSLWFYSGGDFYLESIRRPDWNDTTYFSPMPDTLPR